MDDIITNAEAIFDFINNGFFYFCPTKIPGLYWVRSVAGNWAKVKAKPMDFYSVLADFNKFIADGKTATELEVKNDNTDQVIVEVVKIAPPDEAVKLEDLPPVLPPDVNVKPNATSTPDK